MISYRLIRPCTLLNGRGLSILVFSLFSSWLLAFPFQGQVLYALADKYAFDTHQMVFWAIAAHLIGLFTCGYFIKNIKAAKRQMMFSTVFCIAGSTVFFFPYSVVWHISLVAMSFLAGFFVSSWGFYLKSCTSRNERIKTAADVLIYSNILMILFNIIAVNLSAYAGLAISIIVLVGAWLSALKLRTNMQIDNQAPCPGPSGIINPTKPLFFLCLFVAIITINSGLMYQVINPAFEHHQLLTSWYWAVPYVLALYIVKNLPPKTNRAYILYVAIAMIGFAFISFMILDRSAGSYLIVNTLMLGACGVCDLFWWSIIGEMLDYSDNPAKFFGIGLSANVLGVLIGGIIGKIIFSVDYQTYNSSVIALIVVFVILIILPILNRHLSMLLKNHVFLAELSYIACSEPNNTINDFMKNCELTRRESEIVTLLLSGRTYKMVADELCLSENTVKTHIKNIYSKLNIQSKLELVKIFAERQNMKTQNY